ncbi:hypothetical protein R6Q59_025706 [Mikania micrantha]
MNEGLVVEANINRGPYCEIKGQVFNPINYISNPSDLHLRCSSWLQIRALVFCSLRSRKFEEMTGAKIIGSVAAAFVVAFTCDYIIADKKLFGGTTPSTVSNKDWWEETDKKFQAWPRTAGPPVVMNPISRQNFIVKPRAE